jgi:hypothetical protein
LEGFYSFECGCLPISEILCYLTIVLKLMRTRKTITTVVKEGS